MHDRSFDPHRSTLPRRDRRASWVLCIILAAVAPAVMPLASKLAAQLPTAPVLQNAWAVPGLVAALDIAGGSDGSVYAAAGSWAPASGRFQLSGGGGIQTRTGASARGVYGARLALPFGGASSSFGFGAFAGVGGGGAAKPGSADTLASTTQIPVGAAIGWRHSIGARHGLSVYATPSYLFFSGGVKRDGLVRTGLGVDLGITPAIGLTLGAELGQTRARALGGPSGSLFGLGLSYALGHR
jgi:hypothetical protein